MKPSIFIYARRRWIDLRNRVTASTAFQREAARFPLTRLVARARARELFSLVAGFVYSQITAATVGSGLLDHLAAGPVSAADAAARINLPVDAAERLLRGAASLRLAERLDGNRFMLGVAGAALRSNPGIAGMIAHHQLLYADLADPLALLRRQGGGGALAGFWPYAAGAAGKTETVSDYSALMAASQPMVAEQALGAYNFRRHRRMLDIGGGEGVFAAAVSAAAPGLQCAVFDLPAVAERARSVRPQLTVHAGSFLTDPIPGGYDLLTLVRIAHDHDDATVLHLFCAARAALGPGGRMLIVEPMAGLRGDERVGDAYFGFYLLAMGSGRARTPTELRAMLKMAGFRGSRMLGTPIPMIAQALLASV